MTSPNLSSTNQRSDLISPRPWIAARAADDEVTLDEFALDLVESLPFLGSDAWCENHPFDQNSRASIRSLIALGIDRGKIRFARHMIAGGDADWTALAALFDRQLTVETGGLVQ